MMYDRGGVPPTVITEPQMDRPWDYSKEINFPKPSTNPTEVPLNPTWDSTRERKEEGLYESYPTKNESVNLPHGTQSTGTYEKG